MPPDNPFSNYLTRKTRNYPRYIDENGSFNLRDCGAWTIANAAFLVTKLTVATVHGESLRSAIDLDFFDNAEYLSPQATTVLGGSPSAEYKPAIHQLPRLVRTVLYQRSGAVADLTATAVRLGDQLGVIFYVFPVLWWLAFWANLVMFALVAKAHS